jgi:pyruvate formate lyase activating enzyme
VIGKKWSPGELHREILKDEVFFETSGGGLTVSGGEPMTQWGFLSEFLPLCRGSGVRIALDTCGAAPVERYRLVLPMVDMVLFDLKIIDPQRHKEATGVDNAPLLAVAEEISGSGLPMWIRTPVVPGYTDDDENIAAIGTFLRDRLKAVERWDLLAYTNLGRPKYKRLDLVYGPGDAPLIERHRMVELHSVAAPFFKNTVWSGATR